MKLGIDIDDTIANTFETGMKYAEEFTKKCCNRTYTNIEERMGKLKTHRHWQDVFEWNREEEIEFFKKYYIQVMEETKVKESACEVINKLYQDNEIIIITARYDIKGTAEGNIVENITRKWLNKNNIPYHKLYLGRDKLEVCKENQVDIFIDDSFENCKHVQSGNIKSYLIDHVTNKKVNCEDIERAYGWKDFYQKIEKYKEENK